MGRSKWAPKVVVLSPASVAYLSGVKRLLFPAYLSAILNVLFSRPSLPPHSGGWCALQKLRGSSAS